MGKTDTFHRGTLEKMPPEGLQNSDKVSSFVSYRAVSFWMTISDLMKLSVYPVEQKNCTRGWSRAARTVASADQPLAQFFWSTG